MDNTLYIIYTLAICIISLICLIIKISIHIVKKQKLKIKDYILLIIFLIGMYLYIPLQYGGNGYLNCNVEMIEKAIKLSINPFEKRLLYSYLGSLNFGLTTPELKDGEKAIQEFEKAVQGEYKKYDFETMSLIYLYSIKGDYQKTLDLCKIVKIEKLPALRNVYIMNNEYDKALTTFDDNSRNIRDKFLKSALYKETGNYIKGDDLYKNTEIEFKNMLNKHNNQHKKLNIEENMNIYRTIENYKNWILKERKEYKFM